MQIVSLCVRGLVTVFVSHSYKERGLSVCLSVVCHIRVPCLNRSTDVDAVWQVHFRGTMTHCVRWGVPDPPGEGGFAGRTPSQNTQLQIPAVTWRMKTKSDSACHQSTLVSVKVSDE